MKYCSNCGKELADNVVFCPNCGKEQGAAPQATPQPPYQQPPYQQPAPVEDSGSFGWAVLGFFFPLVGLILFLVWKDQKPLTSKKAGLGALIGVISYVVFLVLYVILIAAIVGGSYMYY